MNLKDIKDIVVMVCCVSLAWSVMIWVSKPTDTEETEKEYKRKIWVNDSITISKQIEVVKLKSELNLRDSLILKLSKIEGSKRGEILETMVHFDSLTEPKRNSLVLEALMSIE